MRLSYSIGMEDFKSLQPPFTLQAGNNAGFKGVVVACVLMILLGVFCLIQGFGVLVAGFLVCLGLIAALAAYGYERRSISLRRKQYDNKITAGYEQIHCRDQRIFEADQNGLTMSCRCESLTRPWSELTSFSENEAHFAFGTNRGARVLPKSAFLSPAQVTEFRALISDKLTGDRPSTSPYFDVFFKPGDYRCAKFVHILKGGGWRGLLKFWGTYAVIAYGAYLIWGALPSQSEALRAGLIGGMAVITLQRFLRKPRQQNFLGKVRVYFSPDGLYTVYPNAQSRRSWSQFVGYLDDRKVLLLYLSPKFYTVIPQRTLTGSGVHFKTMVVAKLPLYDYRDPLPKQPTPAPNS